MAETITIKQLASQAGMEIRALRRLLRTKFPREKKGKAYEWEVNDPQLDLIIQAAADRKIRRVTYNASDLKTTKPSTPEKNTKKAPVKKQPKTQEPKATKNGMQID